MIEQHEHDTLISPPPADHGNYTSAPGKQIVFDEDSRDYWMYYNGDFIGCRTTYAHAEQALDEHASRTLTHAAPVYTPEELFPLQPAQRAN